MKAYFLQSDAGRIPLADDSVDMVFTSPPYMDARTYGIDAHRDCEEWIDWMLPVIREIVRVCRGPVFVNCGGVTRDRTYWPGCEGLLYRWWQEGGSCYRPAYWHRVGIPGSGGKDWLRADVEYVLCFKRRGALPWFEVGAVGKAPKWKPGGAMSNRLNDGSRVNRNAAFGFGGRAVRTRRGKGRIEMALGESESTGRMVDRLHTKRLADGTMEQQGYNAPAIANPGVLISGIKVGGGLMGHPMAHDNEAPFPEALAEFFIKGWSKPGGVVLDPFSGSGTTACVAARLGRIGIGSDLRDSQCRLSVRRYLTPHATKVRKPKRDPREKTLFEKGVA